MPAKAKKTLASSRHPVSAHATTVSARFISILKSSRIFDCAAFLATALFVLAGILVSLNRFWQFETFYYNFGVFDEAIWHVSQFQPPIIEHLLVGGKWNLADHFDLSILLLAPVFWITHHSEVLLIVQALCAGLAGLVIYKIGVEILQDKFIAFCLSCCYFFFVGIQNAIITDFQELTIMTLPVALIFLAIIKKKKVLFWVLFLLVLGYKEVTFALGIGIAIFLFFYNKQWRWHALWAVVVSALWGYSTIHFFIPYFSGGIYLHMPPLPEGIIGKALALIDYPVKRQTLLFSFLQFGFLPFFAPSLWAAILQDYVLRFLPKYNVTYWGLGLHYNAVVSVLLAIAAIFGFVFLLHFKIMGKVKYFLAMLLLLNAFFLFRFILHGPFLLAINPVFYKHTKDFVFLNNLIVRIPPNASVMTQNNLGVRFDHQRFIYLRMQYEPYKPDYILLDNRPGQNPNDFLFAPSIPDLIAKIETDTNYTTIYHQGYQYVFKRK